MGIDMKTVPLSGRADGPVLARGSWISNILPAGGYSFSSAAKAIVGGCAVTGGALGTTAMLAAPFTDGASVPAVTLLGCKIGAEGGLIQYALTGDGDGGKDTSVTNDVREYLNGLLY
jgi:hypothetical protein